MMQINRASIACFRIWEQYPESMRTYAPPLLTAVTLIECVFKGATRDYALAYAQFREGVVQTPPDSSRLEQIHSTADLHKLRRVVDRWLAAIVFIFMFSTAPAMSQVDYTKVDSMTFVRQQTHSPLGKVFKHLRYRHHVELSMTGDPDKVVRLSSRRWLHDVKRLDIDTLDHLISARYWFVIDGKRMTWAELMFDYARPKYFDSVKQGAGSGRTRSDR